MYRATNTQASRCQTQKSAESSSPQQTINEKGVETIRDGVRIIEIVTSRHGESKTITELHMLADFIGK